MLGKYIYQVKLAQLTLSKVSDGTFFLLARYLSTQPVDYFLSLYDQR